MRETAQNPLDIVDFIRYTVRVGWGWTLPQRGEQMNDLTIKIRDTGCAGAWDRYVVVVDGASESFRDLDGVMAWIESLTLDLR